MNIRRDDTVIVLSGDDKGAKGKVIAVSPKEGKVLVEKVNMIHKHVKAICCIIPFPLQNCNFFSAQLGRHFL